MAEPEAVTWSMSGAIARLRLSRPEKRNALTLRMWESAAAALDAIARAKARVLVFEGSPGAFSAGADIDELASQIDDRTAMDRSNAIVQRTQLALERLPLPTVAAIDGVCIGGGLGLALACDLRIATARSRFAITPAKLGLTYSADDTRRLVLAVGAAFAKEMLYTGRAIDATEAARRGLISRCVEDGELAPVLEALCIELLASSGSACAAIKRTVAYVSGDGTVSRAEVNRLFADAFASPDFAEGATAFRERRPPRF